MTQEHRIDMKLFPSEWLGMYYYLATNEVRIDRGHVRIELENLTNIVLLELYKKLSRSSQYYTWTNKKRRKLYNYTLRLSAALALHRDMQLNPISHDQQDFLNKLDERLKSKGLLQAETIHVEGKAGWEE